MHASPGPGADADASYELQVYALSPVAPSPRRLAALAASAGLPIELDEQAAPLDDPDAPGWTRICMRSSEARGASVELSVSEGLERMLEAFRADRAQGEDVPEALFASKRLYVLDLPMGVGGFRAVESQGGEGSDETAGDDTEESEGEAQQAALVLTAWALAQETEGLVFDPQEEFFADAESFWALVMDEGSADDALATQASQTN